jgi:hypothetical protein
MFSISSLHVEFMRTHVEFVHTGVNLNAVFNNLQQLTETCHLHEPFASTKITNLFQFYVYKRQLHKLNLLIFYIIQDPHHCGYEIMTKIYICFLSLQTP